jgi:hypothetical protein
MNFDFFVEGGMWTADYTSDILQIEGCFHEWKLYEGFTDRFHYCVKCDEKDRRENISFSM